MKCCVFFAMATFAVLLGSTATSAATIPVVEDVMTSAFFGGPDFVRGYVGDGRLVHRVASDNAFGVGPETVYLTFNPSDFSVLGGPIPKAILSVESAAGGFGGDATPANPFEMSAHAIDTDPLTAITDDTNPGGPIDWFAFFNNNILPAPASATTTIAGFGTLQFDITPIVNDWISGANTVFSIALTGKNDTLSNGNILHGIVNNSETSSASHFITIVPEPSGLALAGLLAFAVVSRNKFGKVVERLTR